MLSHEFFDDVLVEVFGSLELREHEPGEKSEADIRVVRDESEDTTNKGLKEVEEAEEHPVGQPVLVIVLVGALNCADRVDSGVQNGEEGNHNLPSLKNYQK